jgi:hypothetical protein
MKNTATAQEERTTSGTIAEKVETRERMPTLQCGGSKPLPVPLSTEKDY